MGARAKDSVSPTAKVNADTAPGDVIRTAVPSIDHPEGAGGETVVEVTGPAVVEGDEEIVVVVTVLEDEEPDEHPPARPAATATTMAERVAVSLVGAVGFTARMPA